jgi:hypothetical protein
VTVRERDDRGYDFLIDLPVQNRWDNVDRLRTSVANCFTAIFQDPGDIDRQDDWFSFATVASELMENAIKYGVWTDVDQHLHLRVWGDRHRAHVQVENPVAGDPSGTGASATVDELMATIRWLNDFDNPEDAYKARILEVAAAPSGTTKLGLARIAYEGRCKLAAEVDGRTLRVTGVTSF